jgi:hypothetical protein
VLFSQIGEDWVGQWEIVDVLAEALAAAGELETGVRLYAAVSRHREARGEETPRVLRVIREQRRSRLDHALTSREFASAAAEGRRLTMQEAIDEALTAARSIAPRTDKPSR